MLEKIFFEDFCIKIVVNKNAKKVRDWTIVFNKKGASLGKKGARLGNKKGANLGNRVQLKKGASLGKFGARLGNSRKLT